MNYIKQYEPSIGWDNSLWANLSLAATICWILLATTYFIIGTYEARTGAHAHACSTSILLGLVCMAAAGFFVFLFGNCLSSIVEKALVRAILNADIDAIHVSYSKGPKIATAFFLRTELVTFRIGWFKIINVYSFNTEMDFVLLTGELNSDKNYHLCICPNAWPIKASNPGVLSNREHNFNLDTAVSPVVAVKHLESAQLAHAPDGIEPRFSSDISTKHLSFKKS